MDHIAAIAREPHPIGSPAIAEVRDYLVWSRYPYARVTEERRSWRVHFSDARYDGRAGGGGLSGVSALVGDGVAP